MIIWPDPDEHLSSQVLTLRDSTFAGKLFYFFLPAKNTGKLFLTVIYHYKTSHNYEPTIASSKEILSLGTQKVGQLFSLVVGQKLHD